ncbi:SDR family oxidoreductase [Jatrophihabitans endophyticus]|uniref:SDR family oxidoreductase n=1 Tax=Jatrophihabitans endophyticus TaxID=1206085 RepID=UPI0019DBCD0F|nr:SDR family oxidoreductase [Jatrophihabitans endophyticus]MBE7189985.1 SDR family oxidoreductase [Jatrophihabitans endophyticus]
MTVIPRRVETPDGVTLAVYERGEPGRPTVVAVHGYPDNHAVWDAAADLLAEDFHVVSYDVRGAGESDKPGGVAAYRMPHLVADFLAVADAVSPDEPVHVLAHDWGSIQAWGALLDPSTAGRIASLSSISGPSLDYAGAWLRDLPRHPRSRLAQLARSYYIGLFQVPGLGELAVRTGVLDRITRLTSARHRSARAVVGEPPRSEADKLNGIALYRANMLGAATRPAPVATGVPVHVIVPRDDAFVSRQVAVDAPRRWVERLTVTDVAGGHWVVSQRPDVIARLTREFIEGLPAGRPARGSAAQHRGDHAGRFVVVTGGGRGIGRATALEFARKGADVLIADIDDVAAKDTVSDLHELGVRAWAAHLDVSDVDAWERFALTVRDEHGVPDVLVNNAGIGMGGTFLRTSAADWGRIINVNLWSVIHGSRLFAAQMVERGQGGRIVNVASAAAFSPSLIYPAYATTKAAVLMLTECLTAELASEGIAVTAVCPGFIDSDISASTEHVGVDAETAAALRAHQVEAYHRRGYPPAKVARQLVAAATANAPLVVITPEAKVLRAVSRFAPGLGRRIARIDLNRF